jgi:hypothetical protein
VERNNAVASSGYFLLYGPPARWLDAAIWALCAILGLLSPFPLFHPGCQYGLLKLFLPPVSTSTTDFYHQKTDAELQFFLDNPNYYQPELVAEARRELRRRGALQSPPVAAPAPAPAYHPVPETAPAPGLKAGPVVLGVAVVLALSLSGFYYVKQKNNPATASTPATEAPPAPKAPPQLTEVATSAIPNYDVDGLVDQQLQRVPASERAAAKAAGQPLRQYRELTKRFWAAETQTEYLLNQAQEGKAGEMFADQTLVARTTWSAWNKAAVYQYKFGPAMQRHLELMSDVASSQQHLLEMYPNMLANRRFASDKEATSRATDVQYWMHDLLPVSPVTKQPYKVKAVTLHM